MASSAQTSWTNQTVDMLRNAHVDCKPILKQLVHETLKSGIRFLSQQKKATEGVRHLRLDAWYYIRRVNSTQVLKAISDAGFGSDWLKKQVEESMQNQRIYHVVIRGNDPKLMPLGHCDGQDVPTDYIAEQLEIVVEEVDKQLFDVLSDPDSILLAMSNHSFDTMLEHYFKCGKDDKDATLHLVGRMRGANNLLHACIKEGYVDTLHLLLKEFTVESQRTTPWRVLAEPLRPVGKYKVSAFHRAVYDGREECLKELVRWAQHNGHDITTLRNLEELDILKGIERGLTCLELADEVKNISCYNILAPVFNVPLKEGIDENPRETRMAERLLPRVELVLETDESVLAMAPLSNENVGWEEVIASIQGVRKSSVGLGHEPHQQKVRVENASFEDDITEEQVEMLLTEVAGMALEANSNTFKTDKTSLSFLKVLVSRFERDEQVGITSLPLDLPRKVDVASTPAEDLALEEENDVDRDVAALQQQFVELCGKFPGFIGARNGCISVKQRLRLAKLSVRSHAAAWAAVYGTRVSAFLFYRKPAAMDQEPLAEWLQLRQLMALPRAVINYFDKDYLLNSEPLDVGSAMDPTVIPFLKLTLTAWFATAPNELSEDPWRAWAERLEIDEEEVKKQLKPALDCALESLLRMWKALDPVCKNPAIKWANVTSIGDLIKQCVPANFHKYLPMTHGRLEKYWSTSRVPSPKKAVSYTAIPTRLGPAR